MYSLNEEKLNRDLKHVKPVYYPWAYNILATHELQELSESEYFEVLPTLLYLIQYTSEDIVATRYRSKYRFDFV